MRMAGDVAYPHLSIADSSTSFDLSKCTSKSCGCKWVHCPLCEPGRIGVGTSTVMCKHFTKIHVLPAVPYQADVKLMICRLDCSKQKHYHCPKCGLVVGNTTKKQNGITKHLQLCTGEAGKLLDDLVNMETDHADVQNVDDLIEEDSGNDLKNIQEDAPHEEGQNEHVLEKLERKIDHPQSDIFQSGTEVETTPQNNQVDMEAIQYNSGNIQLESHNTQVELSDIHIELKDIKDTIGNNQASSEDIETILTTLHIDLDGATKANDKVIESCPEVCDPIVTDTDITPGCDESCPEVCDPIVTDTDITPGCDESCPEVCDPIVTDTDITPGCDESCPEVCDPIVTDTDITPACDGEGENSVCPSDATSTTVLFPHASILQGDSELVITMTTDSGCATAYDCSLCGNTIRSLQVNRHRDWHSSSQVKWADCHILGCMVESCLSHLSHRRSRYHFHFHCPWCREVSMDRRSAIAHYSTSHPKPPIAHDSTSHAEQHVNTTDSSPGPHKRSRSSTEDQAMNTKKSKMDSYESKNPTAAMSICDDEVFDTVTGHINQKTLRHLAATSSDIQQRLQQDTGVSCMVQETGLSLTGSWDQLEKARQLIKTWCCEVKVQEVTAAEVSPGKISPTKVTSPINDKTPIISKPNNKSPPMRTRKTVKAQYENSQHNQSRESKQNSCVKPLMAVSPLSIKTPHSHILTRSLTHTMPQGRPRRRYNRVANLTDKLSTPEIRKLTQKSKITKQPPNELTSHKPRLSASCGDSTNTSQSKTGLKNSDPNILNSTPVSPDNAYSSQAVVPADSSNNTIIKSEGEKIRTVEIYNDVSSDSGSVELRQDGGVDLYIVDTDCAGVQLSKKPDDLNMTALADEPIEAAKCCIPGSNEPDLPCASIADVQSNSNAKVTALSLDSGEDLPTVDFQNPVPDDVPVLNIIPQEICRDLSDSINNVVSLNGVNIKLDETYVRNVADEKLSSVITGDVKPVVDAVKKSGSKRSKITRIKCEPGAMEQCPSCAEKLPLIDLVKHVLSLNDCKEELSKMNIKENTALTRKVKRLIEGLGSVVKSTCPRCGLKRRTAHQALYHYAAGFCIEGEPIDPDIPISNEDFCMTHGVLRDPFSKLYKCSKCPMQARKPIHLKNHIEAFHLPKVFSCPHCPRMFTTEEKREYHMRVHKDLVECPQCKKMFMASYLPQHIEKLHQGVISQCDLCDFKTKNYSYLQCHIDNMHSTSKHLCDWCGKHFGQKSTMRKHIQAVHLGIKFKRSKPAHLEHGSCAICGETMLKKNLLTHVQRRHDKVKQYECDVCGAKFTSNNSVKVHKMKHMSETEREGILRFSCDVCDQKFHKRYLQQEHIRSHQITYQCDRCLKTFRYKQTLQQHQKRHGSCNTHGNNDPLKCGFCSKTYHSAKSLANHIYKVHQLPCPDTVEKLAPVTVAETMILDFEHKLEFATSQLTDASQMTEYIVQEISADQVTHEAEVEQILAQVTHQHGMPIMWPKSETAVELQNNHIEEQASQMVTQSGELVTGINHLVTQADQFPKASLHLKTESSQAMTDSGHLVTDSGHLVAEIGHLSNANQTNMKTESGQLVTETGQLVTESGQLMNETGQLVTESGQLVTESGPFVTETGQLEANFVNEQFIEVPGLKIEGNHGTCIYQPGIDMRGLTLMQTEDGTVYETETVDLQEEGFVTIEETDTETRDGYQGSNVQFQCGHCDMLFVSMEEVNAHVIASHV